MARRVDRRASEDSTPVPIRRNPSSRQAGETADILDYMAQVRRNARRNPDADPLVAEIVEALLALGGQAHRDVVAERVASAREGRPSKSSAGLTAHIRAAFEERLRLDRSTRDRPTLLYLPFGDGSHRWALAREAETFLRWGRESRRSSP